MSDSDQKTLCSPSSNWVIATIYSLRMAEKFTGFHSTIREVAVGSGTDVPQRSFLEKRYGPKAQGFDFDRATEIVHHMRNFGALAADIGIPVVMATGHVIYDNGHPNKVDLTEYVPNVGPNLLQVMGKHAAEDNIPQASKLFDRYLSLFKQVWDSDFRISLDPPLTNFCVDGQDNLWYVDCMPPRQKLSDGTYISEWPTPPVDNEQFIIDRYFSPHQARIIYAQALRSLLDLGFSTDSIKTSVIANLGTRAEHAIELTQNERKRLLTNPQPTDVDLLRILASEAYGEKSIDKSRLGDIYKLCHIIIGGLLPTIDEVRAASDLLH